VGPLSPQHGASSGTDGGDGLQMWRVTANMLNKQSRTADRGWSSGFGVGQGGLTTSHCKKRITKRYTGPRFENRVQRIFRPKRNKVTGGWRKLLNEELRSLLSSPISVIKSRRMRWVGHVARMGEMRNAYKIFG
jgi:hypothetical protein